MVILAMNNVECLSDQRSDMVGTWRINFEKLLRVAKGTVLILLYVESI